MAGNRGKYKGRRSYNQKKHHPRERERTTMLNLNRIIIFRYGIKEIMIDYEIDEAVASSVLASLVAKGSRISIDAAKTYVRVQERMGKYPKEVSDEIFYLLDKYSTHR